MSQLTKSNLLFALFLIILVLSGVGITYYFISKENKEQIENIETPNYFTFNAVDQSATVNITDKYPVNPININVNEKVTIEGLKDKEVENKINQKLSKLEPYYYNGKYTCYTNFNVSNVLSITCQAETVNVNLVNGEDIILEEVFQKESDLYAMSMKSLYKSYCMFYDCNPNPDLSYLEKDKEYNNFIENKISTNYNQIKNRQYNMQINYNEITLNFNNPKDYNEENQDMFYYNETFYDYYDYYDDITIYNRFLTNNNIYENKVEQYCNPNNCNKIANKYEYNDDNASEEKFLNDKTYILVAASNYTTTDFDFNYDFPQEELDLNNIKNQVYNILNSKYNFNTTKNYRDIEVYSYIYNTPYNYKQILCEIHTSEYTQENYIKKLFGLYNAETINSNIDYTINMILTPDNNISYLEDDPNKIFTNFEETLYNYMVSQKGQENSPFLNLGMTCDDDECLDNLDYHQIIKDSVFSIDPQHKKIYMYYLKNFYISVNDGIQTSLPYELFTLKETTS